MVHIVVVVVYCHHGANLVVSLIKHSLGVHVCESERPLNFFHAALFSPFFHLADKCFADFPVIHEVNPSEPHAFASPGFVGFVVYNRHHPTHRLPVFVSHKHLRVAKLTGCVLFRKSGLLVEINLRDGKLAVGIHLVVEFYELVDVPSAACQWLDYYI